MFTISDIKTLIQLMHSKNPQLKLTDEQYIQLIKKLKNATSKPTRQNLEYLATQIIKKLANQNKSGIQNTDYTDRINLQMANLDIDKILKFQSDDKLDQSMIESFYNTSDLHYIQRILNPKTQYKYVHLLLDTANSASVLSEGTRFAWNFTHNALLNSGTVNAIGATQDLIAMRIYPVKTDIVTSPERTFTEGIYPIIVSGYDQSPFYYNDFANLNNNFTILIEEFASQAFVGRDGRKFHFVLFPVLMNPSSKVKYGQWTPTDPYFEFVTSGKGNGQFVFKTPITTFSTITISMANPFTVFPLSKTVRTLIPLELIFLQEADEDIQ